jgi:uncharacterized protein (DUF1800 family)
MHLRNDQRRVALVLILGGALACTGGPTLAQSPIPTDDRAIIHALNRLSFGPRPGDIERVKQIGLATWIDQQLRPDQIKDDGMSARLTRLETLTLDSGTIAREYVQPARQARRQRQRQQGAQPNAGGAMEPRSPDAMPPGPREPRDPAMAAEMMRGRQAVADLTEAKILRAVYSERQLEEVLVDFWFNHFNVFARKGQTEIYVGTYEREAIRPHVWGNFRDLLEATAKSPAMLFYLDNWLSADPNAVQPAGRGRRGRGMPNAPQPPPQRQRRGLNENYARELLELHTLGVEGGYAQQDVVEIARAFTGWSIGQPAQPGFRFMPFLHDRGEKKVLGQVIRSGGGMEDGERVLDILAAHPSTARHIAFKLAQRFVSDTPPPGLVTRAAERFTASKGNLREVVRTIVTSPEFFARESYRAKVKTPFEFVASALRATGAEVTTALPIARTLQMLGMPLYLCQPPTGYDETAETWVSSGALVNRMNFAVELSSNRLRGIRAALPRGTDLPAIRERAIRDLLSGDASQNTRGTVAKATTIEQTMALIIGAPEFQRQ